MIDETRCPKCQSTNRAEILWGRPWKKMIKEELKRKEVVLGGCRVTHNDPKWQCNECRTRWGRSDFSKKLEQIEKEIDKKKYPEPKKVEEPSVPETEEVEEIPARIWLKRELASLIGITLCNKCGTRTKIEKTKEISGIGEIGYTVCPKCGHKEKWMYGHP